MSERPLEARLISSQLIADLAARTALDIPGVLRLEPTLKNLLTHLGKGTIQNLRRTDTSTTPARHDGVFVTVTTASPTSSSTSPPISPSQR